MQEPRTSMAQVGPVATCWPALGRNCTMKTMAIAKTARPPKMLVNLFTRRNSAALVTRPKNAAPGHTTFLRRRLRRFAFFCPRPTAEHELCCAPNGDDTEI